MFTPDYLRNAVFILGSARSGTTFLGNCLASLPEISYHYEPVLTKITSEYVYRNVIGNRLARFIYYSVYSALMLPHTGQDRIFSEKTPRNCTISSFLSHAFPGSRFIHIVRDGRDATVSHLKKPWLVASTDALPIWNPNRYIFGAHPRYWVENSRKEEFSSTTDTHRVIWHWRALNEMAITTGEKLSNGRYLRIYYENIIENPGKICREIIAFLKLPWEDECLDFYKSKRAVFTRSNVQVRRPIYQKSVSRWKNYSSYIEPIKQLME